MVVGRVVGDAVLMHVVEIGANRQSCEPSTTLLFKLVLEVVLGVADYLHGKDDVHCKRPIPLKSAD
jgi:hypothetical protein